VKEMVEYSRWLNTSQLRARVEALSVRLNEVQKDLTRAEEKFYRYISTQGSDLLAIQDGSLFTAITSSQQQQREIRLQLQGIQGQINSLSKQLDLTPDQAYTSSALSADPIIASIRAQILDTEAQLEGLRRIYVPNIPPSLNYAKNSKLTNLSYKKGPPR